MLNKIEMVYLSTCPKDVFSFGFGVPSSYQKKEQVHNIEITFLLDEMPRLCRICGHYCLRVSHKAINLSSLQILRIHKEGVMDDIIYEDTI